MALRKEPQPDNRIRHWAAIDEMNGRFLRVVTDFLVDIDASLKVIGIDIDHASKKVDLKSVVLSQLPGKVETVSHNVQ